jgi:hypothetical protein
MGRLPDMPPHSTFSCQFLSLQVKTHDFTNGQAWKSDFCPFCPRPGEWCHWRDLVIPAKAGIYPANLWKYAVVGMDSCFRGNDRRIEWIPIPNDTSACLHISLDNRRRNSEYRFTLYLELLDALDC